MVAAAGPIFSDVGRSRPAPESVDRDRVAEIQRARILAAMVDVCAESSGDVSVAHIVERAGLSRRTFYEIFDGREECFLATFDDAIARASRQVRETYDPAARWAERVRTALVALLGFLDVERGTGWLLLVGSLRAGAGALECRRRVLEQIAAAIDQGRSETRDALQPSIVTAEGLAGGVVSIVQARLLDKSSRTLLDLTGPLMSMVVLPYLGSAAARKELRRPVPEGVRTGLRGEEDPLRDLGMRLTYRTVRVLLSISEHPGASNREIGLLAGIADQGQISKLLTRLQRLGVVRNDGLAPGRGAPNAWTLTPTGVKVERVMSADTISPTAGND